MCARRECLLQCATILRRPRNGQSKGRKRATPRSCTATLLRPGSFSRGCSRVLHVEGVFRAIAVTQALVGCLPVTELWFWLHSLRTVSKQFWKGAGSAEMSCPPGTRVVSGKCPQLEIIFLQVTVPQSPLRAAASAIAGSNICGGSPGFPDSRIPRIPRVRRAQADLRETMKSKNFST